MSPSDSPDARRSTRSADGLHTGSSSTGAAVGAVLCWLSTPAAAHGEYATGVGVGLGPTAAIAGVTAVGLATGVGAARRRRPRVVAPHGRVERLVGPLLALLGVLAVATALDGPVLPALAGAVAGGLAAALVRLRGSRRACADATVGAIGVHRVAEGVAIAALAAADATVGTLTAAVVAVHAGVECLAIGGHPDLNRRRSIGAVLAVQAAFVVGVAIGVVTLDAVFVEAPWLTATVGGALTVFGADTALGGA